MKRTRFLVLILSAVLLFFMTSKYELTRVNGANFSDQPSTWAASDVAFMIEAGLVPEGLQGNYKTKITRSEYASLVYSVLVELAGGTGQIDKAMNEHLFKDTTEVDVYHVYKFGIVNGISELEFKPDRNIGRKEAVVMMGNLMRSLKLDGISYEKAPYIDYSVIPSWAKVSADITYNAKIFQGNAAGMEPDKPYTREQSIVTMKRLLDFAAEAKGISYRGKIFVSLDSIYDVRVGSNYVKIGSKKSSKSVMELWQSVSSNFPDVTIYGSASENIKSGEFVIETLGDDFLIKISW
ncbi:hypothetical protein ACFQZE_14100 [Paenibacillus sp. GCM10027627]|uniref:hypothetical protein n=1 Tax=unclassified Paenibacillus TaxID=185978 RepID=UPI00363F393B